MPTASRLVWPAGGSARGGGLPELGVEGQRPRVGLDGLGPDEPLHADAVQRPHARQGGVELPEAPDVRAVDHQPVEREALQLVHRHRVREVDRENFG
jgi:hypothetical protein